MGWIKGGNLLLDTTRDALIADTVIVSRDPKPLKLIHRGEGIAEEIQVPSSEKRGQ